MATIVSRYDVQPPAVGTPFSTAPLVERFVVRKPPEGLQIVIEWKVNISEIDQIKILRKQFSYPENLTDGLAVVDITSPTVSEDFYVDEQIDELKVYYYTLFLKLKSGVWVTDRAWRGFAFNCKTGFFRTKLYELLPSIYRRFDKQTETRELVPAIITTLKEKIHVNEHGQREHQLFRFLALFATFFDEIKCLIDFIPTLYDVDSAPPNTLEHIASLLGVEFNFDLPIAKQRVEIRDAVKTYKLKGTLEGIKAHAQKITGYSARVHEMVYNILATNRADKTLLDVNNAFGHLIGSCDDVIDYLTDLTGTSIYSPEALLICVDIPSGQGLDERILSKLARTLVDWIPADTRAFLLFADSQFDSVIVPIPFSDSFEDVIETRSFFITNHGDSITNVANILTAVL